MKHLLAALLTLTSFNAFANIDVSKYILDDLRGNNVAEIEEKTGRTATNRLVFKLQKVATDMIIDFEVDWDVRQSAHPGGCLLLVINNSKTTRVCTSGMDKNTRYRVSLGQFPNGKGLGIAELKVLFDSGDPVKINNIQLGFYESITEKKHE